MEYQPAGEVDGKLGEFLRHLNNSYSYTDRYEPPVQCDQCSTVIPARDQCYVLLADRYIGEKKADTDIRLTRIECGACYTPMLHYSAPGYLELVLASEFTAGHTLTDLQLAESSGRSDGTDWDPRAVRQLLDPDEDVLVNHSPADLMRVIDKYFEPRAVVDPETGELLIDETAVDDFRIMFFLAVAEEDATKDDLRAMRQAADEDLSRDTLGEYERLLHAQTEDLLRDIL
jgi:hypothetical protein